MEMGKDILHISLKILLQKLATKMPLFEVKFPISEKLPSFDILGYM